MFSTDFSFLCFACVTFSFRVRIFNFSFKGANKE